MCIACLLLRGLLLHCRLAHDAASALPARPILRLLISSCFFLQSGRLQVGAARALVRRLLCRWRSRACGRRQVRTQGVTAFAVINRRSTWWLTSAAHWVDLTRRVCVCVLCIQGSDSAASSAMPRLLRLLLALLRARRSAVQVGHPPQCLHLLLCGCCICCCACFVCERPCRSCPGAELVVRFAC